MNGRLLVAAQFSLIAWLVWPFTPQAWSGLALLPLALCLLLGVWTLVYNHPGNFNIRPEPKAGGRLVTDGPYRHIRHPMYTAVLLFGVAEVLAYGDPLKLVALALLMLVLWKKSSVEEAALREKFPDYAAYAAGTKRFIPFIW